MREIRKQKLEREEPGAGGPGRKVLQIGHDLGQDWQQDTRRVPRRRIPSGKTDSTEGGTVCEAREESKCDLDFFSTWIIGEQWCPIIKAGNSKGTTYKGK